MAITSGAPTGLRLRIGGKFVFRGEQKLYVRGVTYGTFRPRQDGIEYPAVEVVESDFSAMASHGINAVRSYTVPPRWILDVAERNGLRLMVGIPVERFVGFLADRKGAPDLEQWVSESVASCKGHRAVLCYSIGNEIPAQIVRWHGRRRIERFLERMCNAARRADPDGLVTYANYPSTEYLDLPFLDLVCFNVFLERQDAFEAYLQHLQHVAGDRPLMITEMGLDSRRNGEEVQRNSLDWQVRASFRAGCSGAFVYSWTDEWHAGGTEMTEWDFGLTRRSREPKPALASVRNAFNDSPFAGGNHHPGISVVVCSYNGEIRIGECLLGLQRVDYPDFEVIVVDDGSMDRTSEIAREFNVRVIRTEHKGLSHARNVGLSAAHKKIVAYLDDDAFPDPHWLSYLGAAFESSSHSGIGGPNIAPPNGGTIAECYSHAPGGPVHVLLSDDLAEHIPGCNMAFRKECLEEIGGFDPQFRAAGDDVDVCWRLQERRRTLGFSPAAMVWHHPRRSLRSYWRQQRGYGQAEALLVSKWPDKYNSSGHLNWAGQVYTRTPAAFLSLFSTPRVYFGVWGTAPFQRMYASSTRGFTALPLTPDWYLMTIGLLTLSLLGFMWKPLWAVTPIFATTFLLSIAQAILAAKRTRVRGEPRSAIQRLRWKGLTVLLFLLHPLARLRGRVRNGFGVHRPRLDELALPRPSMISVWSEKWSSAAERLESLEAALRSEGAAVLRGGDFDRWDLDLRVGTRGGVRLVMALEEHGQGRQLIRLHWWPWWSQRTAILLGLGLSLTLLAALDSAWVAAALLLLATSWLALQGFHESAIAACKTRRVVLQYAATAGTLLGRSREKA